MNTLNVLEERHPSIFYPRASLLFVQIAIVVALWCVVSGTAAGMGGDLVDKNFARVSSCTKTTLAANTACRHETADNYWIATGNCENLSDMDARAECMREAVAARKEGNDECGEQFGARLKLCAALGEAPYDPQLDPAMFVDPAQIGKTILPNPYFPLVSGRRWLYKGGTETITVTVTGDIREILGIPCAVVHDVVKDSGEITEDTKDWFAQDIHGNVWYCGEISQKREDGELVSIDGSWTAGKDSAKAGIIMKAHPAVDDVYRQEFSLGNAEDVAAVLTLRGSAMVPAAVCGGNCLVTKDFTPLDPGAIEHKYYALGVGLILELDPKTGKRVELVEVKD